MPRRHSHDELTSELADRLKDSGNYRSLNLYETYQAKGYCGEYDIAARRHNGRFVYFEVKSSDHHSCIKRAEAQFIRFFKAYPQRNAVCVLYTPKRVRLYHRDHFS